jgi:hypothetical protein
MLKSKRVRARPRDGLAALPDLEQATAGHHAVYQRWVELTEKITG